MNNPNELIKQLRQIFSAINIFSATGFRFAGQDVHAQTGAPAADGQPQNPMTAQLQQMLYLHGYSQRFCGHLSTLPTASADGLMAKLASANHSQERWITGWQILQTLPSGQVAVSINGQTRTLWPGEFITDDGPGSPPRPGALVRIFAPRESTTMQPGFYFAFGEALADSTEMHDAVRFYWNIDAAGAPQLMQLITQKLNRFQIPFRFKCTSNHAFFYRIDSAILFVNRRHCHITARLLAELYTKIQPHIRPETPLFTQPLAPGLAFAEEPTTGESFGMSRCRLLAEGIWSAYINGSQAQAARLQAVQAQFEQNGISFAKPHLRPGSVGWYEFPTIGEQRP